MNIMYLTPSPTLPLSFPNPLTLAGRPSPPPLRSCFLGRSPGNVMVPEVGTPVKKIRLDNIGYSGRKNVSVSCFSSKGKGFGPEPARKEKSSNFKSPNERKQSKILSTQPPSSSGTPGINRDSEGKSGNILSDRQFMDRLEAVRRSAIEQKKTEEERATGTIDYDAPIEMEKNTIGLGTRIGVGIAVAVFGLVFALGDFLPSGLNPNEDGQVDEKKLKPEEKAALQARLQQYQETLEDSPNDLSALEGAAVTSVDLGDYNQASDFLEKLTSERPKDPEAYRLLGEVKYLLKDYDKSAAAYKNSLSASEELNFESLRGLTNALLAAKKPEEAVQVLLSSAERLNDVNPNNPGASVEQSQKIPVVDPIQVQLLLGKAYSDWGHVGDAVSVYDQLISKYPVDFRGYLAKGILLKENGKAGDAERMFIQARFFAPEKAKPLVDRYARR